MWGGDNARARSGACRKPQGLPRLAAMMDQGCQPRRGSIGALWPALFRNAASRTTNRRLAHHFDINSALGKEWGRKGGASERGAPKVGLPGVGSGLFEAAGSHYKDRVCKQPSRRQFLDKLNSRPSREDFDGSPGAPASGTGVAAGHRGTRTPSTRALQPRVLRRSAPAGFRGRLHTAPKNHATP